jgi:hypothetical protein
MRHRPLFAAAALLGAVVVAPGAAQAGWSEYRSQVSEVDACNQAQYLMPDNAVAQEFRSYTKRQNDSTVFACKVRWSDKADAQPTDRPILFPSRVRQPIFAAGWL